MLGHVRGDTHAVLRRRKWIRRRPSRILQLVRILPDLHGCAVPILCNCSSEDKHLLGSHSGLLHDHVPVSSGQLLLRRRRRWSSNCL